MKRSDSKLDILKEKIYAPNHNLLLDHTIILSPVNSERNFKILKLAIMNNNNVPPFVR